MPQNQRARLSVALRRVINVELPRRDTRQEVIIRSLENSEGLRYSYNSETVWLYYSVSNHLIAGTLRPGWRSGWEQISRDKQVQYIIDLFFHFASQYIDRSRMVGILGALAATFRCSCEFRYHGQSRSYVIDDNSPFRDIESVRGKSIEEEGLSPAKIFISAKNSLNREFNIWMQTINGLDPYIHRAIYQFWKATALDELSLIKPNLSEDVIAALDNVVSIAAQFSHERISRSDNQRQNLATTLGISRNDQRLLKHLYELRCDFGAHPSRSKWWDFAEIYEDDIELLYETVKRLLWHLCQAEKQYRTVEMHPKSWSTWFQQHSLMVLDAVWFTHIRSIMSSGDQ